MDFLNLFLLVAGLVCIFAFAFVVYHVVSFALNRVNVFRVSQDKKPFSNRLVFVLSLASALSFLL